MDKLTKYEKGVLEKIIFRDCSKKRHNTKYLKTIESIYVKLFNENIQPNYNKWVQLNKNILKGGL